MKCDRDITCFDPDADLPLLLRDLLVPVRVAVDLQPLSAQLQIPI